MRQRLTVEEKKALVQKVSELSRNENVGIKEACKRLGIPWWNYYSALRSLKPAKRTTRAEGKPSKDLKVELVFKGDAARLIREYAEAYGVEPEVVCRIMLIDALKE